MSGDNDTVERHFDSIIDFLDDSMDGNLAFEKNRGSYNKHNDRIDSAWYGLPHPSGTKEIHKLIHDGWTDGAKAMAALSDDIQISRLPTVRRRRAWSDQGDELSIDRLYAGALDVAWRRPRKGLCTTPPRIRIVINMATPFSVKGREMFWRGAAGVILADKLTEAGYTIQIISAAMGAGCWPMGKWPKRCLYSCVVKDWRMPMELSGLASTTALAGMFRKFGFLQIIKMAPAEITNGICAPMEIPATRFAEGAHKTFVINACNSKEDAMAWLKTSIAAIKAMTNS